MIRFIDVSHHDLTPSGNFPNLLKVKEDGIFAIYAKATEGIGFYLSNGKFVTQDPTFDEFVERFILNEFLWGAFHYFRVTHDPIAQANLFYRVAKATQLPPTIDVEKQNNLGQTLRYFTDRLKICVDEVERLFNRAPIIYTSFYAWKELTTQPLWAKRCGLWDANYQVLVPKVPYPWNELPEDKQWLFWQDTGVFPIAGDTFDGNLTRLTKEEFYALGNVTPPPTLESRVTNLEIEVKRIKEIMGI